MGMVNVLNLYRKSSTHKFNQDAYLNYKIGNCYYSLVADGFGTSRYSHVAAKYIVKEFNEFFELNMLNSVENIPEEDIVAHINLIRNHLLSVKPQYDEQFGACFSLLKFYSETKDYEIFHIGDTHVFGIKKDIEISFNKLTTDHNISNYISNSPSYSPNILEFIRKKRGDKEIEHIMEKRQLTQVGEMVVGKILMNSIVMDKVFFNIQIIKGNAKDFIGFVVCSDGWEKIWKIRQFEQAIDTAIRKGNFDLIDKYLDLKEIPDDITVNLLVID